MSKEIQYHVRSREIMQSDKQHTNVKRVEKKSNFMNVRWKSDEMYGWR